MPESGDANLRLKRNDHARVKSLRKLKNFELAFDGSFSLVAYISNRFLIDHLLRVGRLLTDNDFETMVIWGVLAHQNVAHLMPPGSVPTAVLTERGRLHNEETDLRPLKLRDISAITGIPRETVRRKLDRLATSRYARRLPEGWVVTGERNESDLRDFSRDTVIRLAAVCEEMLDALEYLDEHLAEKDSRKFVPNEGIRP